MFLFYLLFLLAFIFGLVCKRFKNGPTFYLNLMFCIFGFLMMFKGIDVGNDTSVYAFLFDRVKETSNIQNFLSTSRFENGSILLCYLLSRISDNYQILFIFTGAFMSVSFCRFIKKYSNDYMFSVIMFLTLQYFDQSISGFRQMLAVSIVLYSYDYIIKKKPFKFIIIVLIASMIHTSTIFFLLLYPLSLIKEQKKVYIGTSVVGVMLFAFFTVFISIIDKIVPQYSKYLTGNEISYSVGATSATIIMFFLWLTLFIIGMMCRKKNSHTSILCDNCDDTLQVDRVMDLSTWIGVICMLLAINATILGRFKYIFSFSMIVFYPNSLLRSKDEKTYLIVKYGSIAVFLAYAIIIYTFRPEWQSTYPYSFCW